MKNTPAGKEKELTLDKNFVRKLQSMTWEELDKADLLDALSGFPAMYGEKFKDKFGHWPGQKK